MEQSGATVLVEDDEDHAFLARWALDSMKKARSLIWLRDGEEALSYLTGAGAPTGGEAPAPKLILLDINLPKVSGKEALRQIRSCAGLNTTPVVMLTTSDRQEDVAECYALGANSYVIKPVQFEDLSRKLRAIVRYWRDMNHTQMGSPGQA